MPISKLKKVVEYCSYDVPFFIFIFFLIFIVNAVPDVSLNYFDFNIVQIIGGIVLILLNGYGMAITRDRINHGYRLPKIIPGDVISLGIKSTIFYAIFAYFQTFILSHVSDLLNLEVFDLEELLFHFQDVIHNLIVENPADVLMFIFIGGIIFYITTFFVEIGLARLADTKSLLSSFNLKAMYKSIRIFGFRNYILDYTSLVILIVVFALLQSIVLPNFLLDNIWEMFFGFLIFVTQYLGIGAVYCDVKDAQINSEKSP